MYTNIFCYVIDANSFSKYRNFREAVYENKNKKALLEVCDQLLNSISNAQIDFAFLQSNFLYYEDYLIDTENTVKLLLHIQNCLISGSEVPYKESFLQYYFHYLSHWKEYWFLKPVFHLSNDVFQFLCSKSNDNKNSFNELPYFHDLTEIVGESNHTLCVDKETCSTFLNELTHLKKTLYFKEKFENILRLGIVDNYIIIEIIE